MGHTGFTWSSVDGAPWILFIYCFYVDHFKRLYCNLLQYCSWFLIYLFLAMLGLWHFTWAFSICGESVGELLFIAVLRLLIVAASLVVERGL